MVRSAAACWVNAARPLAVNDSQVRGRSPTWPLRMRTQPTSSSGRRAALVVAACLVATTSLLGVEAAFETDVRLLLVPTVLSCASLVLHLRRLAW